MKKLGWDHRKSRLAPNNATISRWMKEFRDGRLFHRKQGSGRPRTARSAESIRQAKRSRLGGAVRPCGRLQSFWEELQTISVDIQQEWFQQDGATRHTAAASRLWLQQRFPGRVISLKEEVQWAPHSPDLSPLDFFLWGYLKNRVYKRQAKDILTDEARPHRWSQCHAQRDGGPSSRPPADRATATGDPPGWRPHRAPTLRRCYSWTTQCKCLYETSLALPFNLEYNDAWIFGMPCLFPILLQKTWVSNFSGHPVFGAMLWRSPWFTWVQKTLDISGFISAADWEKSYLVRKSKPIMYSGRLWPPWVIGRLWPWASALAGWVLSYTFDTSLKNIHSNVIVVLAIGF